MNFRANRIEANAIFGDGVEIMDKIISEFN
jgi:hypothetical protein